jgi:hypothetical protein
MKATNHFGGIRLLLGGCPQLWGNRVAETKHSVTVQPAPHTVLAFMLLIGSWQRRAVESDKHAAKYYSRSVQFWLYAAEGPP